MATLEEQLQALYLEELGREADAGGLQFYLDAMASGDKNLAEIAMELSRSTEGLEYDPTGNLTANAADTAINYLYAQELNRNAEQGGLDFYSDLLSSGGRELDQILAEINLSEEGRLNDPTESIGSELVFFDPNNIDALIENAYATELGRAADEKGLEHYRNLILNDPTMTLATTLQALSRSNEGLKADIGDLVFNGLSGEDALATAAALDQSVYQPFEDIYGGTDEATGLLGTQLFADRTATYQQRDAITAAANEAAAKGDTVLAEGLQKQADALTDKLGTSSPWTIGETTGGTRDIYDVLEKGGIATVDPTTGNLVLAGGNEGVTNYNLDYNAASNVAGAGANQTDVARVAAAAGISIDDQYAKNATNTFNDSFNYGQYGKRPDETLTQYYDRLATNRQGGILGQGLLSATPTVGSDAWNAAQTIAQTAEDPRLREAAARSLSSGEAGTIGASGQWNMMPTWAEDIALSLAFNTPTNIYGLIGNLWGKYAIDRQMDAISDGAYVAGQSNPSEGLFAVSDKDGQVRLVSPATFDDEFGWDETGGTFAGSNTTSGNSNTVSDGIGVGDAANPTAGLTIGGAPINDFNKNEDKTGGMGTDFI